MAWADYKKLEQQSSVVFMVTHIETQYIVHTTAYYAVQFTTIRITVCSLQQSYKQWLD